MISNINYINNEKQTLYHKYNKIEILVCKIKD